MVDFFVCQKIILNLKQTETINRLTDTINDKDEIIDNLRADKEELKGQLHKFKEFWRNLLKRFQEMIGFNNDEKYRTTIINFNKYPTITFAMSKIMKMSKEEQNQVALYLYNNIN